MELLIIVLSFLFDFSILESSSKVGSSLMLNLLDVAFSALSLPFPALKRLSSFLSLEQARQTLNILHDRSYQPGQRHLSWLQLQVPMGTLMFWLPVLTLLLQHTSSEEGNRFCVSFFPLYTHSLLLNFEPFSELLSWGEAALFLMSAYGVHSYCCCTVEHKQPPKDLS